VNCIVFPLKDARGKIVSLYGRTIKQDTANKHFYLKERKGLYPFYPDPETKILLLTESIIDCGSLLQIENLNSEIKNLSFLACYGVNGFTQEHRQAIKELQHLEEIIITFDNDTAGQQASHKLAQELLKIQPKSTITQVDLPSKDINEVLQLHNPEIFTQLLEQRKELILSIEKQEAREQSEQEITNQNSPKTEHLSLEQINELIGKSGIIGEENTRLLLFIIASSYKTQSPLHAIVQGSSGSGKTHLISKIAQFIPQEDVLKFTRITESSLYNWGEWDLVGKLMVIEDLDGLKEEALYSLRELISNQQLSSSVSIKDKKGNIKSTHKKVRGVFSSLSATTKADVYEDNISRSFILAVDESTQQSKKIIQYQNQKYAGEVSQTQEKEAKEKLQNYLRNLQQVEVINPYATQLELPEEVHKIRRLNQMYQSIIRQITYLNQRQRRFKNGCIYTEIEDLEQATEILFESILLKIDELDGSLRQFYERLKKHIKDKNQEFTQREIRQALNISKSQLQRYIHHLLELDYIRQSGGYTNRGLRYKIDYWDNYQKLRNRIKQSLYEQIETLKTNKIHQESPKGSLESI
ncbi:toprim domain-containing protein, partial [Apibacter muscae]|uniref:toprim domain-containing protein n=1 Tax=Apibacter muscae TaxID=2509004 RepID=UPI0011AC7413